MSSLRLHLGASEDGASVRVYRALFGLLLAGALVRLHLTGWTEPLFLEPTFRFEYEAFAFVPVIPKGLVPWVLALGALGAFWDVRCLAFLVALFPWPAHWRTEAELRAYAMTLAIARWVPRYPAEIQEYLREIQDIMTSWTYYRMWQDVPSMQRRLDAVVADIDSGAILVGEENAPFRMVHAILREEAQQDESRLT